MKHAKVRKFMNKITNTWEETKQLIEHAYKLERMGGFIYRDENKIEHLKKWFKNINRKFLDDK